jgi:AbrB family looped-hinge helix DNA binding protein
VTSIVDAKGRLTIPAELRRQLGLREGDVVSIDAEDGVLRVSKSENPFDALAEDALNEFRAGGACTIEEYARSRGLEIDA